jgi:glycine betaine/proline transport system ATP-binding protein
MTGPAAPAAPPAPPPAAPPAAPMVVIDNVSIVFGDKPASAFPLMDRGLSREEVREKTGQILGVHDCSLTVGAGEIMVLMGLSGSGKSTLLRAVNGLNPVARGTVTVAGADGPVEVGRASAAQLRALRRGRIAMVFQQFGLLPWRSVRDNVALGLELSGLPERERLARADGQLELVGLTGWGDRMVAELSGGMQQRVGLARAFATDAPILLMDEPFSALDPLIRARLQDELLELQSKLGRTILFVSHDLDEALKIGARIAIMEGGRMIQTGAPHDIVLNPATGYVADFVANMNPLGVLRAAEVMTDIRPGTPTGPIPEGAVTPETPINALIDRAVASDAPIPVVSDGALVGAVDRLAILRALVRRD